MLKRFYKWLTIMVFCTSWTNYWSQETPVVDSLPKEQILFNKAGLQLDSGKTKEAVILFKQAVKIKPDYWEAFNRLALCKIRNKEYKESLKDLEKADKIAPFNYETLKLKGISYYHLQNYKESKAMLDTAQYVSTEEKIDDAELQFYRASLMFAGKNYKTALEVCEVAVDYKPNYMEVFLLKGEIRFVRKEYNYAIKELSEAIRLMPETKPEYKAYKLRAKSKFEVGDFKGAITDWDVYIDGIPKEEEALVSRGAAKINVNDNSGAIADLDAAIAINSKNPVSWCYRGVAKGGNKQYVEALKDLDYAIKLKFDYAPAYVNRAAIKFASKDKRGACADLEKADGLGDEMALKLIEKYCKDNRN